LKRIEFEEWISSVRSRTHMPGHTMPPVVPDLFSLYSQVKDLNCVAALEFGSGWSTLVMAQALKENQESHSRRVRTLIRHPNPFRLLSVETSRKFQRITRLRLKLMDLHHNVLIHRTKAVMHTIINQNCHVYANIPPFTADFIYLDGPDCEQVQGDIRGFTVNFGSEDTMYGLPMSADLLFLEPYFWPGTRLVLDGRGANASFLRQNFRRNWSYQYEEFLDQHFFTLEEMPWGKISQRLLELKFGS